MNKYVTTQVTATYEADVELTKPASIVHYFRELTTDAMDNDDRPLLLSDVEIWHHVSQYIVDTEKSAEDNETDIVLELLNAHEGVIGTGRKEVPNEPVTGAAPKVLHVAPTLTTEQLTALRESNLRNKQHAAKLAEQFDASKTLSKDMLEAMDAEETRARAPVQLLWDLVLEFGVQGMEEFPEPGYGTKENPERAGSNQRLDITKQAKTVNGVQKQVDTSWYDIFVLSTREGARINSELNALEEAKGTPRTGKYASVSVHDCKAIEKTAKARKAYFVTIIKKAVRIHRLMSELNDRFGKEVSVKFMTDRRFDEKAKTFYDVLQRTKMPLIIINAHNPGLFETYTYNSFLRLDIAKAQKDGGTYTAVVGSIKRDAKKKEGDKATMTVAEWTKQIAAIGNLSQDVEEDMAKQALLMNAIVKPTKGDLAEWKAMILSLDKATTFYDMINSKIASYVREIRAEEKKTKSA